MEEDWRRIGEGGLEEDWRRIGRGLEEDWKRLGRGLERRASRPRMRINIYVDARF